MVFFLVILAIVIKINRAEEVGREQAKVGVCYLCLVWSARGCYIACAVMQSDEAATTPQQKVFRSLAYVT